MRGGIKVFPFSLPVPDAVRKMTMPPVQPIHARHRIIQASIAFRTPYHCFRSWAGLLTSLFSVSNDEMAKVPRSTALVTDLVL